MSEARRRREADALWRKRLAARVDPGGPYACMYCPATFMAPSERTKHELAEERRMTTA